MFWQTCECYDFIEEKLCGLLGVDCSMTRDEESVFGELADDYKDGVEFIRLWEFSNEIHSYDLERSFRDSNRL